MQTKCTAVFVLLVVVTMFIGEGSTGSTQDLEAALKTYFEDYDNNDDGLILISDKLRAKIHKETENLGLPEVADKVLKKLLSDADTDRDGKLSWKELEAAFKDINLL